MRTLLQFIFAICSALVVNFNFHVQADEFEYTFIDPTGAQFKSLTPIDKDIANELNSRITPKFHFVTSKHHTVGVIPPSPTYLPRPTHVFGDVPTANTLKVFGVGLSRTSTTSLSHHLASLGLTVLHYDAFLTIYLNNNSASTFDWRGIYDKVDAVMDLPTSFYYKELYAVYPNSVFISTERNPETWFKSFEKYLKKMLKTLFLGQTSFILDSLHTTVYGSAEPDHNLWIENYKKHYARVIFLA